MCIGHFSVHKKDTHSFQSRGCFAFDKRTYATGSLHMDVSGGGVIHQCAVLREPGPMAGTVPGVFLRVPFERTSHMGTAGSGRFQKVLRGFICVYEQLRAQDASGGRKKAFIGISFFLNQVR